MDNFITGEQVLERWKKWRIERHDLMKMITCNNERGGYSFQDFCKELWPYSPAYLTPIRLDIHKCFQLIGKEWSDHCFGFLSPPLPLADNHNWECCHIINFPADIYNIIDEVLFKITDIEMYEKTNFPVLNEPRILLRRELAIVAAKLLRKKHPKMTRPKAIEEINLDLVDNGYKAYSGKRLSALLLINGLVFPPGKRGPKTKK